MAATGLTRGQLDAIRDALVVVLPGRSPADVALKFFFRDHKQLGSKDRALVADTVYSVLRHRRVLEAVTPAATPRDLALGALVRFGGVSVSAMESVLRPEERTWLTALKARDLDELPFAVRAELPDWVVDRLRARMSDAEILALAASLQRTAPFDLRVNSLKAPREAVIERLERDGVASAPTRHSPLGVRVKEKIALAKHPMFLDGAVEVQDEGSQLLGLLVEPRRTDMVVDFCAGAGGKTLQLGAAMNSQGRLYAFDVSDKRLANLTPRLRRSGLSNVHPQRIAGENDPKVKRLRGKIDRVLVDAPCTGFGTLRRNPDLKTRQGPDALEELNVKQRAILEAAAALVKPGGRVVYGTCSLLAEENEAIVEPFLSAHPEFRLVPAGEILSRHGIALKGCDRYLRLSPEIHDTDGFFAAVLERVG
ncbi:MAG TPA: RsmB/NOP family class I SAM-dependent RNA methyltransferase [Usitatibacteraceae bacterium]|nr:RsmB/NOP family class I SAM-dependent RNA methyltransferase [Usitatibacteraceae bacterium]